MKKPEPLERLLADLREASVESSVVTISASYATIYLEEYPRGLTLDATECELLFEDEDTVRLLYEALGEPKGVTLELNDVVVEEEVTEAIREMFTLDEG